MLPPSCTNRSFPSFSLTVRKAVLVRMVSVQVTRSCPLDRSTVMPPRPAVTLLPCSVMVVDPAPVFRICSPTDAVRSPVTSNTSAPLSSAPRLITTSAPRLMSAASCVIRTRSLPAPVVMAVCPVAVTTSLITIRSAPDPLARRNARPAVTALSNR